MGGHPFPEIPCIICAKAIDLSVDLCADENGKAVHDNCYVNHIAERRHAVTWQSLRSRWEHSRFGLDGLRDL